MRRSLAALAALAALVCGCSHRNPVAPPSESRPPLLIAFTSDRPPSSVGFGDLYFYDAVAKRPAWRPPNVDTPSDELVSALSGNGAWMVYSSTRLIIGTISQTFLYRIATGEIRIQHAFDVLINPTNPTLSYDGRYVASQYQIGSIVELDIALADAIADTMILTPNLHQSGAIDFDPSLSGDGKLIAFMSNRVPTEGGFDIHLYDVAGDSLIPLPGLNSAYNDDAPSISRDGRYITFQSNRAGGAGLFDVYLYDRQTAALVPLPGLNSALSELLPAISPDGRWIAYASESQGGTDIRLYDLRTQQQVSLPGCNDGYYVDRFPQLAELHGPLPPPQAALARR